MKKVLFLLSFIAMFSVASIASPVSKDVSKVEKTAKNEKVILKNEMVTVTFKEKKDMFGIVSITIEACGQSGTFAWDCGSIKEFLLVCKSIVDTYCHTGPCA